MNGLYILCCCGCCGGDGGEAGSSGSGSAGRVRGGKGKLSLEKRLSVFYEEVNPNKLVNKLGKVSGRNNKVVPGANECERNSTSSHYRHATTPTAAVTLHHQQHQ